MSTPVSTGRMSTPAARRTATAEPSGGPIGRRRPRVWSTASV